MANNLPTHNLCMRERSDDPKAPFAVIGAGWVNDKGSISIKLNLGTVLSWKDDVVVYLFKRHTKKDEVSTPRQEPFYTPLDYPEAG